MTFLSIIKPLSRAFDLLVEHAEGALLPMPAERNCRERQFNLQVDLWIACALDRALDLAFDCSSQTFHTIIVSSNRQTFASSVKCTGSSNGGSAERSDPSTTKALHRFVKWWDCRTERFIHDQSSQSPMLQSQSCSSHCSRFGSRHVTFAFIEELA